ncbi:MAG: BamA/TamA family outer membrane protein [Gemmatimonadetes bacterium]|nr:BamA/TamA family outer membrane protein [Gemmatimonadota bacterium]
MTRSLLSHRPPGRTLRLAAAALMGAALPAAAQEKAAAEPELSAEIAFEIVEFYNRPATIRLAGASRLAPGSEVLGDVAVLGGPFVLGGRVRGRVVVINGNVQLESGAEITGDLLVVGGGARGLENAAVGGTVSIFGEPLRFRLQDGSIVAQDPRPGEPGISAGRDFTFGRTDFTVIARRGYNRVEGLPVTFGPRLTLGGSNPTRLEALLIYRTVAGLRLDSDELGYTLRGEQFLGGRRAARLGLILHSETLPIEDWGLSDRENSLATFLLHRDYRDHYQRVGWSAYLRLAPRGRSYDASLEYAEERHEMLAARGPWALVDNDEEWRPQPAVAEGRLRSLAARLAYDTRNQGADPSAGWYVRARLERGLGGSLRQELGPDPATGEPIFEDRPANDHFLDGLLDLRRYARMGPRSKLGVRALLAGSLDGKALPPQRQHALGGEGSLPAYALLSFDCGARRRSASAGDEEFYPFYGCDRLALVQLEYQATLPMPRRLGPLRLGHELDLGDTFGWVLFFDAGRAWTEPEARSGRGAGPSDFAADAGLGLRLGRLGFYWAIPLAGSGQGLNFFVRLGPRF